MTEYLFFQTVIKPDSFTYQHIYCCWLFILVLFVVVSNISRFLVGQASIRALLIIINGCTGKKKLGYIIDKCFVYIKKCRLQENWGDSAYCTHFYLLFFRQNGRMTCCLKYKTTKHKLTLSNDPGCAKW